MIEFSHGFVSIGSDRPVPLAGRAGSPRVVGDAAGTLEANMLAVFPRAPAGQFSFQSTPYLLVVNSVTSFCQRVLTSASPTRLS
jgi:hypothetical protein